MNENNTKTSQSVITEDEMSKLSAYANSKNPKNQTNKSGKGRSQRNNAKMHARLTRAENKVQTLERNEKKRIENTPSFSVGVDSIDLVYTGKVAGKTTHRYDNIVKDENIEKLKPLLTPIVSVCNAILKSKQITEQPIRVNGQQATDTANRPVYRATSLTKARLAYGELFENPEFVQKLTELNQVIEEIQQNAEVSIGATRTYSTTSSKSGKTVIHRNPELASSFEQLIAQIEGSDGDSNDSYLSPTD